MDGGNEACVVVEAVCVSGITSQAANEGRCRQKPWAPAHREPAGTAALEILVLKLLVERAGKYGKSRRAETPRQATLEVEGGQCRGRKGRIIINFSWYQCAPLPYIGPVTPWTWVFQEGAGLGYNTGWE